MVLRRSRQLTLIALFVALAVVLNRIAVPAPYAGFLLYGIWEVPVLVALLVLGFWGGATVAVINAIALEFINPGGLPTGPLYNLFAELSMFLGVMAAQATARRGKWSAVVLVAWATVLGAIVRTGVMTLVNDLVLAQPYPIGFGSFGVTQAAVPGLLVLIGIFNITTALYIIPAGYSVMKAVATRYPAFGGESTQAFTP
jgi:riboflavin transporter FmnP